MKDRTEMKRALGKLIIVEVNLPEKASDEKCGLAGSNSSPRQENTALGFYCTGWYRLISAEITPLCCILGYEKQRRR